MTASSQVIWLTSRGPPSVIFKLRAPHSSPLTLLNFFSLSPRIRSLCSCMLSLHSSKHRKRPLALPSSLFTLLYAPLRPTPSCDPVRSPPSMCNSLHSPPPTCDPVRSHSSAPLLSSSCRLSSYFCTRRFSSGTKGLYGNSRRCLWVCVSVCDSVLL